MKVCVSCYRLFDDDAGFCPFDATQLSTTEDAELPQSDDDPRIGGMVCDGAYQVWRKVADGGMGRVYQALDIARQRSVALKVLHAEVAQDDVALERFKREYALSSELQHDHIVEVLDFKDTEDGSYALVMEYLEGEELRMFLQREKKASPARLIRMLSQLAIGLKEPHKLHLVHRDIKPDNIFLCDRPEGPLVKLLDFGSVRDNSEGAKKLTVVGTTIGSPFYMSPEQAQGLPDLDHRADVWSLAAIGYECLTGQVPFYGTTGPAILLAILGKEPDPASTVAEDVPEDVDDVFADALTKEASTRIGSVAELADRFGQAYGLAGTHQQWAEQSEKELRKAVAAAREQLKANRGSRASQEAAAANSSEPAAMQPMEQVDPFVEEDDFIMGVPSGPPKGLIIGLVVAGVLIVSGIVAALLL